jgi:hypothetical protein
LAAAVAESVCGSLPILSREPSYFQAVSMCTRMKSRASMPAGNDRKSDHETIYLMLPIHYARRRSYELLLRRVEWRLIHVMANRNLALDGLPEATLAQRNDLLPALARGTGVGSVARGSRGRNPADSQASPRRRRYRVKGPDHSRVSAGSERTNGAHL